jgi:hypothetical protein
MDESAHKPSFQRKKSVDKSVNFGIFFAYFVVPNREE